MASAATDASASASIGSKRTLPSDYQGPIPKRAKMETELDGLKAQQKVQAALLKKWIEAELEIFKGKNVAKEPMLRLYCNQCDEILAGMTLSEKDQTSLNKPFARIFEEEGILANTLGDEIMEVHRINSSKIDELLPSIAKLTGAILAKINSPTREEDERERKAAQKHEDNPAPSQAAEPTNLETHQTEKDSQTIYDGRPVDKTGPLLSVYHRIFAEFEMECGAPHDLSPLDVSAARILMESSTQFYPTELDKGMAIKGVLHHFLGPNAILNPTHVKGKNRNSWRPHGLVRPACGLFNLASSYRIWMPSLIFELKNDIGGASSDPLVQACFDYDLFCTHPEMMRLRRASCDLSCMPVFILGILGPYLSIGGAIHVDNHVVFQHLTPCHPLIPLPNVKKPEDFYVDNNDRAAAGIAHIFRVLKRCLDKLEDAHGSLHPDIPAVPTALLQPSPHFKTFQYKREQEGQGHTSNEYQLKYISHILSDNLSDQSVFRADACRGGSTIPCVVKFAVRYGAEAHRIMEKLDAAVELLYCNWEPTVGRWVVITKFHEPLPVEKQTQAGINHLREALVKLHDQGYVHGDVRAPNIIIDKDDKPRFLDFDWSHKIGEVRYPNNLNPAVEWPYDASGGGLIKAEHDLEMLNIYSEYVRKKMTTS